MNLAQRNPWTDYPRPQLKRDTYSILNGKWLLNGKKIIVPFPPQSDLSEYNGDISDELIYELDFEIPNNFNLETILLHFGAVDQIANVWINNEYLGKHEGGYLPFTFDITNFVKKDSLNHLVVKATDTLSTDYPYGKQCKKRGGMWYTPISGIWQTVWLENVPTNYIKSVQITPDLSGIDICLNSEIKTFTAIIELDNNNTLTKYFETNSGRINLENISDDNGNLINKKLWTPNNPQLYNMRILTDSDEVRTYFALRKIEILNINGVSRACLNEKPIFMHGILDQGYFSDGIYLPKDSLEYKNDILRMKDLGFNTLRKHIKIEPEMFYYYCDKLGMLVIQDMVNSGPYSFIKDTALPTIGFKKRKDNKNTSSKDDFRKEFFIKHMNDTITHLYNHPSILVYTIFNEGWGQFDSDKLYDIAKNHDPSRLYDSTSGWFAQAKNDFDSVHIYFRSKVLKPGKRPLFLSECGGFTYKDLEHCFNPDKTYGYGACKSSEELTDRIISMYEKMVIPAITNGLCGCIYTQLSDVEDEVNGFYTYDRAICKVNKEKMKVLSDKIYSFI